MHSGTRVGVGYNVQIAVDSKHNLIAEQQVHSKVSDLGLLAERRPPRRGRTSLSTRSMRSRTAATTKIEDMEDCEAGGDHALRAEAR